MNESFEVLLSQTGIEKFFRVVISSSKITPTGALRIAYYNRETRLRFDKKGYDEVLKELRKEMAIRDKRAKEIEKTYQQRE